MRDRGIPLVITSGVFFDEEALENHHQPQAFREQRYKVYERLAAAFEGGVDIAVGTDGMVGKLANEVRFLSGLGASAEKAVRAATLRGADIAGLGATVGTIEPGKRADVISVSGNPCEDLRSLDYVGLVMMSGKRIDPVLQQMYEREEEEAYGGDEHA
jgi:imidazolonepropionase-like amidohydrolase